MAELKVDITPFEVRATAAIQKLGDIDNELNQYITHVGLNPTSFSSFDEKRDAISETVNIWSDSSVKEVKDIFDARTKEKANLTSIAKSILAEQEKIILDNNTIIATLEKQHSNDCQEVALRENRNTKLAEEKIRVQDEKTALESEINVLKADLIQTSDPDEKKRIQGEIKTKVRNRDEKTKRIDNIDKVTKSNQDYIDKQKLADRKTNLDTMKNRNNRFMLEANTNKNRINTQFKDNGINLVNATTTPKENTNSEATPNTEAASNTTQAKESKGAAEGKGVTYNVVADQQLRNSSQITNDMYRYLRQNHISAEKWQKMITGNGFSDITKMLPHLDKKQKRDLSDVLKIRMSELETPIESDTTTNNGINDIVENVLGVRGALPYSLIIGDDSKRRSFSTLSSDEMDQLKTVITAFHEKADKLSPAQAAEFDKFMSIVSIGSLIEQTKPKNIVASSIHKVKNLSQKNRLEDVKRNELLGTMGEYVEERNTRKADFLTSLGKNVNRGETEVSMSEDDAITRLAKERGVPVTNAKTTKKEGTAR